MAVIRQQTFTWANFISIRKTNTIHLKSAWQNGKYESICCLSWSMKIVTFDVATGSCEKATKTPPMCVPWRRDMMGILCIYWRHLTLQLSADEYLSGVFKFLGTRAAENYPYNSMQCCVYVGEKFAFTLIYTWHTKWVRSTVEWYELMANVWNNLMCANCVFTSKMHRLCSTYLHYCTHQSKFSKHQHSDNIITYLIYSPCSKSLRITLVNATVLWTQGRAWIHIAPGRNKTDDSSVWRCHGAGSPEDFVNTVQAILGLLSLILDQRVNSENGISTRTAIGKRDKNVSYNSY